MKKVWIIVMAAVLILAVVLLALLIFARTSPSEVIDSEDPTSLYPYSFEQTKDGLEMTISGPFPKDCSWTAESQYTGIAGVSELRQNANKAKFLITPVSWGRVQVTFCLDQDEATEAGHVYELDVAVEVDTNREITIAENGHREDLTVSGGSEQYNYRILSNTDGSLELYADNDSLCKWSLRVVGECVAAAPVTDIFALPEEKSETRRYHISGIGEGTDTLQLCSEALGENVIITVEAAADGTLTVTDHQISNDPLEEPYEYAEQEAAYRYLLGEPALPAEAKLEMANAIIWVSRTDSEKYLNVGVLDFEMKGQSWELYGSDEAAPADLYADLAEEAGAPITVEANGKTAEVYEHPDGAFAGWQSDSGRTWFLQGDGAGTISVTVVAQELLKVVE